MCLSVCSRQIYPKWQKRYKSCLVWPPFASLSATHLLHRVDQVVDCGLWDVGSLLFNGCVKLLDIGRNWNTLSYTPIQSIPNMLNGWHIRRVCWPCKNWDVFSFQELCTDACIMGPCIIMLNMRWWSWMNGTTMGLRISSRYLILCIQKNIKTLTVLKHLTGTIYIYIMSIYSLIPIYNLIFRSSNLYTEKCFLK